MYFYDILTQATPKVRLCNKAGKRGSLFVFFPCQIQDKINTDNVHDLTLIQIEDVLTKISKDEFTR